jgi:hypothetical protein
MPKVTIFLPISRADFLPKVFHALEMLECDPRNTNLFTYIDGPADLYIAARNFTEASRFAQRLCVQRPQERAPKLFDIRNRRQRIAEIQNAAKEYLQGADYIFGLEDDSVPRADALAQLQRDYALYPYAGMISGIEIGRWGINHLGLWSVDDVYDPTVITSLMPGEGMTPVDATGLYTYLTKAENFLTHHFEPWGDALGPDAQFGLALRQAGFMNYADFKVPVQHMCADGRSISLSNTEVQQVRLTRDGERWRQEIVRA